MKQNKGQKNTPSQQGSTAQKNKPDTQQQARKGGAGSQGKEGARGTKK